MRTTTTLASNDDAGGGLQCQLSHDRRKELLYSDYQLHERRHGSTVLNWSLVAAPDNDDFATATALSGDSGTTSGNNSLASIETGENFAGNESVWFTWWPLTPGRRSSPRWEARPIPRWCSARARTSPPSISSPRMTTCPQRARGTSSRVPVRVITGTTYRIRVASNDGGGDYTLNWAQRITRRVSSNSPARTSTASARPASRPRLLPARSARITTLFPPPSTRRPAARPPERITKTS